jgi:phosphatidylserine/phosphatidylglycerophosphate/cardiolipin synthase-like enzyme
MLRTLAISLVVVGCVTPQDAGDDTDPNLDGKEDAASPIAKGGVDWSSPRAAAFADSEGNAVDLVYMTFELSGAADITLETVQPSDKNLDTILYVYKPSGAKWGAYVKKNDDSGADKLSKLTMRLDAGAYRVLVKRRGLTGEPKFSLSGSCSGAGCTPPVHGCTPTDPRIAAPGVFVGFADWQSTFEKLIDGAQTSLDIQMYQFSVQDIADHVIAAQQRGVDVRVILDGNQTVNAKPRAAMVAAGVPLQSAPAQFAYSHAKYLVADGALGVIATGNFNDGAVTKERNYALTDTDPKDVADLETIFAADWSDNGMLALDCTRLIVSPINSQQRILDHINGATKTLDLELLYLNDQGIRDAIVAAAGRGVAVRVLLNDPGQTATTQPQIDDLKAARVPVGYNTSFYLHAKIIIADGIAHVGSENMSVTSLTKNREVGAFVSEGAPMAKINAQFESDWAGAVK